MQPARGRLSGRASESKQDLLAAVIVQPRREISPMIMSVPMRRDRDETEPQVGHGHGESCVLEDPSDLVEFVEPREC
jgi:hypothetical protein